MLETLPSGTAFLATLIYELLISIVYTLRFDL